MLFELRVLVKIVLTLVLLDHKLSYLHVLQCSHHSYSFFTIVFISFSPGDPLALGPLPLGYPNGKYNNNNNKRYWIDGKWIRRCQARSTSIQCQPFGVRPISSCNFMIAFRKKSSYFMHMSYLHVEQGTFSSALP